MIQIKVDIEEMKSGRVAVELLVGKKSTQPPTEGETRIACRLKMMMAVVISEIASKIPGSSLAVGEEDVETLKGMENLDLKKETDDA
jgi:hypothetical protein